MALFFLASPLWRRLGIAFVPSRLLWLPWLLLVVACVEVVCRGGRGEETEAKKFPTNRLKYPKGTPRQVKDIQDISV